MFAVSEHNVLEGLWIGILQFTQLKLGVNLINIVLNKRFISVITSIGFIKYIKIFELTTINTISYSDNFNFMKMITICQIRIN